MFIRGCQALISLHQIAPNCGKLRLSRPPGGGLLGDWPLAIGSCRHPRQPNVHTGCQGSEGPWPQPRWGCAMGRWPVPRVGPCYPNQPWAERPNAVGVEDGPEGKPQRGFILQPRVGRAWGAYPGKTAPIFPQPQRGCSRSTWRTPGASVSLTCMRLAGVFGALF